MMESAMPGEGRPAPSTGAIWAALLTVYVGWGGTYVGIRLAIDTMPPLLMASTRYLVAGGLLYIWAVRRGDREGDRPTRRHWLAAAIIGVALLLGGNGMVTLAEQRVPSGIAALVVATVPLWLVLLARVVLRERVRWLEWVGVAVGLGGVALLAMPTGAQRLDPLGIGLVVVASISWATGSLYARRASMPARPLVGVAMEMLAGGLALGVVGIFRGELAQVHPERFSMESILGLLYLIVVGSWFAFSAYVWLLRVARTSLVATYAYVNPVVAVFLGWLILSEPVTPRTLLAGLVILVAVAMIVWARSAASRPAEEPEPRDGTSPLQEERVPI
jgi:drug/metabolite transporter (DMT)-like permease